MRKTYMIAAIILILILFLALLYFYVTSKRPQEPLGWLFTIDVNGEKFKVLVKNSFVAEELRKILRSERFGIVIGELRRGDGGFNKPWSWHLDPDTVEVADAAIELCDGMPSFVESELEYWLNVVKRYCPWNTKVVAEEPWYGVRASCWLILTLGFTDLKPSFIGDLIIGLYPFRVTPPTAHPHWAQSCGETPTSWL